MMIRRREQRRHHAEPFSKRGSHEPGGRLRRCGRRGAGSSATCAGRATSAGRSPARPGCAAGREPGRPPFAPQACRGPYRGEHRLARTGAALVCQYQQPCRPQSGQDAPDLSVLQHGRCRATLPTPTPVRSSTWRWPAGSPRGGGVCHSRGCHSRGRSPARRPVPAPVRRVPVRLAMLVPVSGLPVAPPGAHVARLWRLTPRIRPQQAPVTEAFQVAMINWTGAIVMLAKVAMQSQTRSENKNG